MRIVTCNTIGRYGRWANMLYQVAGVIGIARRNGFDFAFPQLVNHDHKERFGSDEDCDVYRHFINPLPLYDGPTLPDHSVQWGYHEVNLTHSVSLSGHFQSERYFDHCIDEVRWYLTMTNEPPRSSYTAIHVRRGDYDGTYHPRVPEFYYREAMKLVDGPYLVFSDDIPECRRMFGSDVEYSDGRDYLDDFRHMKTCSKFIIANSSYSAIAAVLSDAPNKQVVAPRPWFGPGYVQITGEDIYGTDWRIIDWQ